MSCQPINLKPNQSEPKGGGPWWTLDPLNEEPGVYEESQDDQVARYFNSPQGKMDLAKYGKVQARKKAKTMAAIMH